MILLLIPAIIAVLTLTTFFSLQVTSEAQKEATYEQTLHSARAYAEQFNAQLSDNLVISRTFSSVLDKKSGMTREEVLDIQHALLNSTSMAIGVGVIFEPETFDRQDARYANTPGHDATGRFATYWNRLNGSESLIPVVDIETSDWYTIPKTTMKEVVMEPLLYEDVLMTSYITPIIRNHTFTGTVGIDVALKSIDQTVRKVKIFDTGYAFLVSNKGVFVSYPRNEFIGTVSLNNLSQENNNPELAKMADDIYKGREGYIETIDPLNQKNVVMFYSPIKTGNWSMVMVAPTGEMLGGVMMLGRIMLLIGIFSIVVIGGIVILVARNLSQPIIAMSRAANQIASGNLDIYVPDQNGELGILANAFNDMAAQLRDLISNFESKITELQNTQAALQTSEERLRLTLDAANDGIWDLNLITGLSIFSPRWYTMLGYEPGELTPSYDTWRSLVHPEDLKWVEKQLSEHLLTQDESYTVEFRMKTRQGGWLWIFSRGKVIERDHEGHPVRMVGAHTDITNLKRTQEELAKKHEELVASYEELSTNEEELRHQYDVLRTTENTLRQTTEYLENLITYANVPIMVWNPEFTITRVNHAFENLTGNKSEEVVGKPIEILFPPEKISHSKRLLETTQAGVRWDTVELEILHQNGTNRTVIWNSSTIYTPDGFTPVATFAQGQDVTFQRILEKENEYSVIQIQKNLAQLSILNDQIRNPLTIILGSAEMSDDPGIISTIAEQTRRIDETVTQLDLRWMESEKILSMLRKNYQIYASPTAAHIMEDHEVITSSRRVSNDNACSSFISQKLLVEEVEAELYTILDSIEALIYVADLETYEILYLNRTGRNLFGEIAGKKCYLTIQKGQKSPCSFCNNSLLTDQFGPTGVHMRIYQNTRNSRWYDCRDRAIRWSDGRLVHLQIATDITEQKKKDDTLRESEEKYRLLVDHSNNVIFCVDKNGYFTFVNEVFASTLGKSVDDFTGKSFWDVYPNEHADQRYEVTRRVFLSGKTESVEMVVSLPDKNLIYLAMINPVKDADGKVILVLVNGTNITEFKQVEKSLLQANQRLNLLSSITRHDILNKISIILGYLEVAEGQIEQNEMNNLIGKIGSATKAIQSQIEFTHVYQNLGTHLPYWQKLDSVMPWSHLPETIGLIADVPFVEIFADPLLERVFFNLIDNSVRHGEKVTEIRVFTRRSDNGLIIVWEDNGIGIREAEKGKIFERGFGKNTGLGMFLIREILSLTDILIQETGKEGEGVRFEILVPFGKFRMK